MSKENKLNALGNIITFLHDNEQYGDDWSAEIHQLNQIIDDYNKHSLVNWEAGYDAGYQEGINDMKKQDSYKRCISCGYWAGHDTCAKKISRASCVCPSWIGTD